MSNEKIETAKNYLKKMNPTDTGIQSAVTVLIDRINELEEIVNKPGPTTEALEEAKTYLLNLDNAPHIQAYLETVIHALAIEQRRESLFNESEVAKTKEYLAGQELGPTLRYNFGVLLDALAFHQRREDTFDETGIENKARRYFFSMDRSSETTEQARVLIEGLKAVTRKYHLAVEAYWQEQRGENVWNIPNRRRKDRRN